MSKSFIIAIPARYESTRLPGKALRELAGKPLVQHVWERAIASQADKVIIATDDERIAAAGRGFGAEVCMTGSQHRSGTDRLAECAGQYNWDEDQIIVNLQGDEPLIDPALLDRVADDLANHQRAGIATLCAPITDAEEFFAPDVVKVVRDAEGYALYFSRAPIPWRQNDPAAAPGQLPEGSSSYRHIGIYAYRARVLRRLAATPAPAIEQTESLEQLRALYLAIPIHVAIADGAPPAGVDTAEDLERVEKALQQAKA